MEDLPIYLIASIYLIRSIISGFWAAFIEYKKYKYNTRKLEIYENFLRNERD